MRSDAVAPPLISAIRAHLAAAAGRGAPSLRAALASPGCRPLPRAPAAARRACVWLDAALHLAPSLREAILAQRIVADSLGSPSLHVGVANSRALLLAACDLRLALVGLLGFARVVHVSTAALLLAALPSLTVRRLMVRVGLHGRALLGLA